jgi:hypothetical protein
VKKIAPEAWLPAATPELVHVAPAELGWQLQLEFPVNGLRKASPPPPPPIDAPAGSVMLTVRGPVAAVPVSSTWKLTRPPLP